MSLHSRSSQSTKESKKSKGKEPQKQGSVDSIKKKAQPRLQRTLSPLEFHPQPVPHYVVVIYQHLIHVLLSGYNFPLYRFDIRRLDEEPSDETILCSQITTAEGSTCLSLLLATGRIVLLSLPTLKVIAETTLTHPLTRAHESSITPDGRIMTWTAKYELEQDLFLLNNGLPFGNSVILYNKNIQIPPHPASAGTSKQKKSWISTVADAFSKDTMTMAEFDAIMGKQIPAASDPPAHASGRQPPQCDTSESGEPSGSTNVFKELANKMNERGDKLNQLEHKFQDMNQASGDFLKAVRDYNERQARKKWWEF
ncbi:uncharacterized protein BYT42DRAFT_491657 [Radiomyces spectabilis]|uniref:uncharacterized protein n=1 Tax=Radiomyces spectabilis TaxID=64574 RepID=UPI00221FEA94|nr:uncharacterized protein BYT42DRAFT_491657 [Radiomyces spectabilis]KAI8388397.1 hypothetical protein BYT42DRAFT_491657 [Radiomyces spectabilis]